MERSSGDSLIGMVFVPNTLAPPGVSQISSVLGGNLMFNSSPQNSSKKDLYTAVSSRNAMQAVSGNACSCVSTGGCCACSASGLPSTYPVARESQKFPPKKAAWVLLNLSTGKFGE